MDLTRPYTRRFLLFVPIFYDDSPSSLPATMPCINSTLIKPSFLVRPALKTLPGGAYIVTKNLSIRDGEFEYRIESIKEPFERVVRESELRSVGD